MSNKDINRLLSTLGFDFPKSEDELNEFNCVYENFQSKGDATKIDPKKILAEITEEGLKNQKPSGVDFHKRTVLAAEIVFQLRGENTLGHLKLQKLIYLCQHVNQINIYTNYLKKAMGPYDPRLMRSLDSQFEKNEWFKFSKDEFIKYKALDKMGGHKEWYQKYFETESNEINYIIELFRKSKTRDVELIATLFACWKECNDEDILPNEETLSSKLYGWHEDKKKFTKPEVLKTISWMKYQNFFPKR